MPRVKRGDQHQSHICLLNMCLSQQNTVRQEKINTAGGHCVQIGNCAPQKMFFLEVLPGRSFGFHATIPIVHYPKTPTV